MTNQCPFCGNYAYAASVGDAYRLDCRYCEIQVEITKRAYAARCPDPVAVLDYIREKMKTSTRPRVDIADMKRRPLPVEVEETMPSKIPGDDNDLLTSAAKAIGTTLGKIAVKTGMAQVPAPLPPAEKKAAPRKKSAAGANLKTPVKRSLKKSGPAAKVKNTAPKTK